MNEETTLLKIDADYYRELLLRGVVSYDTAREHIMPYIDAINKKSKELAKKYKVTAKIISFSSFVR